MILFLTLAGGAAHSGVKKIERQVAQVLDDFHDAASRADFEGYFGLMAEDSIFIGTDASERWTYDQFKAFTKPYFDQGKGWTYVSTSRHIYFSGNGQMAWFDETLENSKLGECRGSGVMVKRDGSWKLIQYNLTVPIPNELVLEVVDKIRAQEEAE